MPVPVHSAQVKSSASIGVPYSGSTGYAGQPLLSPQTSPCRGEAGRCNVWRWYRAQTTSTGTDSQACECCRCAGVPRHERASAA